MLAEVNGNINAYCTKKTLDVEVSSEEHYGVLYSEDIGKCNKTPIPLGGDLWRSVRAP